MLLLIGMVKLIWKSKTKPHKVHKNKKPFRYFNYVSIGNKKIDKQKIHFKRTFENKVQF
jgi:hypothetical protein